VKTLVSLSLNNPAEVRTEALYSTAGGLRQQFVRLKKGADTVSPHAINPVLACESGHLCWQFAYGVYTRHSGA